MDLEPLLAGSSGKGFGHGGMHPLGLSFKPLGAKNFLSHALSLKN